VATANEQLARIQQQFRRQADAYERLSSVSDAAGLRRLVMLSRADAENRVLDVACGPAFLAMAFAEVCREVVGVDGTDVFVNHARAEARRRELANVRFVLGDVERMPLADASFDVAACRAAFHHFPRPAAVLAEMIRVTKPGARFVIADQVSAEDPDKAAMHNEIERLCDPTHVRALSESEFERLFATLGLTVAFKAHATIGYSVREWMSHGGPPPESARAIERKMRDAIDGDAAGLAVRIEGGELHFSHTAVAFLVEKTGSEYISRSSGNVL
jgi:ubiquinone/menaquinone biosynthesis C-methylase UbiE